MNISNSLPKTFLIYGVLLLGILYILATLITSIPIPYIMSDIWVVEREGRRDLIYIKGTLTKPSANKSFMLNKRNKNKGFFM